MTDKTANKCCITKDNTPIQNKKPNTKAQLTNNETTAFRDCLRAVSRGADEDGAGPLLPPYRYSREPPTECTKPSHSSFAIASNFCRKLPVANFYSQTNSRSKDENFAILFAKPFAFALRIPSQRLIRNFSFEIWWLKFASAFSGRVRIRIRIRGCIAVTAVRSGPQCGEN